MTVPYIFANAVGLVPASELDVNFAYVSNNVSTANTVASNAQPNITSVGTLTNLSVAGNVIAARVKGEGGNISNIQGANVSGTVANATYAVTANSAAYSTNSIQANIANIANIAYLVTGSNVSGSVAQANIANIANSVTGSNVSGSVAQANIANIANSVTGGNVSGQVANALISGTVYTNAQPNITSVGTLTSLSTSGNITGGNLLTSGLVSVTGNITGGNLLTGGLVSVTGNITGGNLSGTNIVGTLLTASQTNITSVGTLDSLSATGNIAGARLITSSFVSAVGNVTAGNVRTVGLISATGNVTGNYFIGNGSQLTGISGGGIQSIISNGTSNINIATANGNATITANAVTYTFGTDSTLTLPGGSRIRPLGANLDIFAGTGSYVQLINSNESSYMGVDGAGCYITTAGGSWGFSSTGTFSAPGNFSAVGTVTGNNISAVTAFQLPVYANTTTRDTAISSPTVGMLIVVGNTYQGYNGASWGNITLT